MSSAEQTPVPSGRHRDSRRLRAKPRGGRKGARLWLVAMTGLLLVVVALVSLRAPSVRHPAAAPAPKPLSLPRPARSRAADLAQTAKANDIAVARRYAQLGYPIYCGRSTRRLVALTFDDGPGPRTRAIVQLLHAAGAPATFFEIGRNAFQWPQLARAEAATGAIGDHTWSHPPLTRLTARAVRRQLTDARVAIIHAIGEPVVLFRPPYAVDDRRVNRIASQAGLVPVLWSVDSRDWQEIPLAQIKRNLATELRPGAIILFHEQGRRTLPALRWLLTQLTRRHLRAVTVPALLRLDGPDRAQLQLDQQARACASS